MGTTLFRTFATTMKRTREALLTVIASLLVPAGGTLGVVFQDAEAVNANAQSDENKVHEMLCKPPRPIYVLYPPNSPLRT